MKKIYFLILSLSVLFLANTALAFAEPTYPIAELGNCKDKQACSEFCYKPENMSACIDYGEKNGMVSAEEAKMSKIVAQRIKDGTMPGNCKTKDECEKYCQGNVATLEECLNLAEDVGISNDGIAEGKKILKALKEGAKMPGDCKNKGQCEKYCQDPANIDECLTFAEKAQIIPADQLAEAKKVAPFLRSGDTPGKCKTKLECENYCNDEAHSDVCLTFAEKAGFISKEEAEMAKKAGGKGPGGCKGSDECNKYCQDPAHLQECIDFGIKVGAIKEEDVQKIKEGGKMIKDGLAKIPEGARSAAESCLNDVFDGKLQDVLNGTLQITKDQGDKIGPCFEKAVQSFIKSQMPSGGSVPSGQGGEGYGPPTGTQQAPPSGVQGPPCSSPEECLKMFGPK